MKLLSSLALIGALSMFSFSSHAAGSCGAGKITQITEGGWNTSHFMIQLDYSQEGKSSMSYGNDGMIRFLVNMHEDRFQGIKALAYLAFSSGRIVHVSTSNASCAAANALTIFAPGVGASPPPPQ